MTADRLNRLAPGLYHAAVRAEVWLAQGDVAPAAAWARTSGLDPTAPPSFVVERETLDLARVLLAEARRAEAIPLLAALLGGAETGRRAGAP